MLVSRHSCVGCGLETPISLHVTDNACLADPCPDNDFTTILDELFCGLPILTEPAETTASVDAVSSGQAYNPSVSGATGAVERVTVNQAVIISPSTTDQATMTVDMVDTETQTKRQHVQAVGTQTPRSGRLYLPEGVTVSGLVNLVHESPDLSIGELLRSIARDQPNGTMFIKCWSYYFTVSWRDVAVSSGTWLDVTTRHDNCQRTIRYRQSRFDDPCSFV